MRIKKNAASEIDDLSDLWMDEQEAVTDSEPAASEDEIIAPSDNPDNDPDLAVGDLPDSKGFPVRMHGRSDLRWARFLPDARMVMVSDGKGSPATAVDPLTFLQSYASQDGTPLYPADLERMKEPPSSSSPAVGMQEARALRSQPLSGSRASGVAAGLGAAMAMPFNWMAAGGRAANNEAQKCIMRWRERSLLRSDNHVADLQTRVESLMDRIKQRPEIAPFVEKLRAAQKAGDATEVEKLQQGFQAQFGPQSGTDLGQDIQDLFDNGDQLKSAMKANLKKTAAAGGDVTTKFVSHNQTLRQLSQDPATALIKDDNGMSLADKFRDAMKSLLALVKRLMGGQPPGQEQETARSPVPR